MSRIRWLLPFLIAPLVVSPALMFAAERQAPVRGHVIPYVIVHDARGGIPGPPGGGPTPPPTDHTTHYVLLPGARSSSAVTYVVEDPGIAGAVSAVQSSFDAWNAASGIAFSFGGTASVNPNVEIAGPNGTNTVSWALLVGSWTNALAVTISWIDDDNGNNTWDAGEEILESDLLFNSKYKWAVDPDGEGPAKPAVNGKWYDIQNVGTHEAGHFVGLDDQNFWDDETMFYAAAAKETKKRSLEPGDIAGAQALYGP
jgi:hypothetical protein